MAKNLLTLVEEGKVRRFWLQDGLLLSKGNCIFIPKADWLKRALLAECHDTQWAGYSRGGRTLALLEQGYYWAHMWDGVEEYVRTFNLLTGQT